MFRAGRQSHRSSARLGTIRTPHGRIATPAFCTIATSGAVKSLTGDDLRRLNAQIILSNAYHQLLRPGISVLKKAHGLHAFMDWHGPLLTDSGGFQVFSLARMRKILPNGVKFQSHVDGKEFLLTPKKALEIQEVMGSDIRMVLDVCPAYPCSRKEAERAVALTTKWAAQTPPSLLRRGLGGGRALLFAIVQGSVYKDLRLTSALELVKLDFDGYAIGGLAVGESASDMFKVLAYTVPELPKEKPRYLMGVGRPEQIMKAVKAGIDLFDCVIPTREARHGRLYFWKGAGFGYETVSITNACFAKDLSKINAQSSVRELKTYTKAYLCHLFKTQEPLAIRLATLNNVDFYLELMRRIRTAIAAGRL